MASEVNTEKRRKQKIVGPWVELAPSLVFLIAVFVVPVLALLRRSLFDPSFTFEHYARLIHEPVYLQVIWITFKIALIVTALTLLLGYPFAYVVNKAHGVLKWLLLGLVLLPFWTSLLVRTFAFMMLLQGNGVINQSLRRLDLISAPIPLVYNLTGVLIGMTYMLLPYMVLPLYGVLQRIDPFVELSAMGLGAGRWRAFCTTTLPLSFPGIATGSGLVFLLSLGFFVTPTLLGGRHEQMISMLISDQVNQLLNWGFASALCVLLITATLLLVGAVIVIVRKFLPKPLWDLAG